MTTTRAVSIFSQKKMEESPEMLELDCRITKSYSCLELGDAFVACERNTLAGSAACGQSYEDRELFEGRINVNLSNNRKKRLRKPFGILISQLSPAHRQTELRRTQSGHHSPTLIKTHPTPQITRSGNIPSISLASLRCKTHNYIFGKPLLNSAIAEVGFQEIASLIGARQLFCLTYLGSLGSSPIMR